MIKNIKNVTQDYDVTIANTNSSLDISKYIDELETTKFLLKHCGGLDLETVVKTLKEKYPENFV